MSNNFMYLANNIDCALYWPHIIIYSHIHVGGSHALPLVISSLTRKMSAYPARESTPSWILAPPESLRPTSGAPSSAALSIICVCVCVWECGGGGGGWVGCMKGEINKAASSTCVRTFLVAIFSVVVDWLTNSQTKNNVWWQQTRDVLRWMSWWLNAIL